MKILKILLKSVAVLFGLLLVAGFVMYMMGKSKLDKSQEIEPVLSSVAGDSALVARGEHVLARSACRHCHGEDLSGNVLVDAPPFRMVASNLTSGAGGIGSAYTVADWDRAIRNGVKKEGLGMLIMPSDAYRNLSDEDAEALIAYLQQVEPVDNALPDREIRGFGYLMLSMSKTAPYVFESGNAPARTPDYAPTPELGAYLASTMCEGCHGVALDGNGTGGDPESPPPPSLAAAAAWSLDAFITTIRTGVNPGGRELANAYMPWEAFKNMTDIELEALHTYVRELYPAD